MDTTTTKQKRVISRTQYRAAFRRHGMNWIRQDKRLAIYLRDGLACAYCGASVESGVALSLDHVHPIEYGGCNNEHNLVTACKRCNDSKRDRDPTDFIMSVTHKHGLSPEQIADRIVECVTRSLKQYRVRARKLIASRGGSSARVIASMR